MSAKERNSTTGKGNKGIGADRPSQPNEPSKSLTRDRRQRGRQKGKDNGMVLIIIAFILAAAILFYSSFVRWEEGHGRLYEV